jgi:3-deoxy-manno-octulosonate cytidylyltransferase (CMP-KDO synthetase)
MGYQIVIPARFASTRLPGKPLADIAGKPMVVRVYERCCKSNASAVYVATDDETIQRAVEAAGGKALLTRRDHASGTDRLAEVAVQLALSEDAILVNVQGDEPLIPATVIEQVAVNLTARPDFAMATLCEPITDASDIFNPNIVKVVFDESGRALYFSRAPLPWQRDGMIQAGNVPAGKWWRHVGIYAYRVGFLHQFVGWPMGYLERLESLEQLRAMEKGAAIHVEEAAEAVPGGVDTPEDLMRIQKAFR